MPIDGEAEEDGRCPPHVLQWAKDQVRTMKIGRDKRIWPSFIKLLDNPSIFNKKPAQSDYYTPDVFIFWDPVFFWPRCVVCHSMPWRLAFLFARISKCLSIFNISRC
jgi:hypothetical protein